MFPYPVTHVKVQCLYVSGLNLSCGTQESLQQHFLNIHLFRSRTRPEGSYRVSRISTVICWVHTLCTCICTYVDVHMYNVYVHILCTLYTCNFCYKCKRASTRTRTRTYMYMIKNRLQYKYTVDRNL